MTVPKLNAEILQQLKTWHDEYGYACNAHNEGQDCCVDLLIEEPEELK